MLALLANRNDYSESRIYPAKKRPVFTEMAAPNLFEPQIEREQDYHSLRRYIDRLFLVPGGWSAIRKLTIY
jgi:hypothetical protein